MELAIHILALFYEVFVVMLAWLLGATFIKIFTLGKGRVGKIRFLSYNQKKKWNDTVDGLTGEQLAIERRISDRTFNVGICVLMMPILIIFMVIGYYNWT